MCGIAGILDASGGGSPEALRETVSRMTGRILHRGPDAGGAWADPNGSLALGHRRLAILDLSQEGAQPMASRDGRLVTVFNGEIYNFRDLRGELAGLGHAFRGHSDTEVMLAAFRQWGIRASVERFRGMFAFAVWDREARTLTLGRDRIGEKPLYYGWVGGAFLFASELKAMKGHPGWEGAIDPDALAMLFRHSYIPCPFSIYKSIRKLPPGTLLEVSARGGRPDTDPAPAPYWTVRAAIEKGRSDPFRGDETEAVAEFETLLRKVIADQMVADVPLGAFLSGGVDSSAVVALMQAQSGRAVKSFTIGFHEKSFDESAHAKAVARHLGTEHTELCASPEQALAVIPRLPAIYDEPFADVSQVPTVLVSQLTRRHVTVCLSGDGGDELLGGYNRYLLGRRLWSMCRPVPWLVRQGMGKAVASVPPAWLGAGLERAVRLLPASLRQEHPGDKLLKLTDILGARDADDMYAGLVTFWKDPARLALGSRDPATLLARRDWAGPEDFTDRMMYLDTITYLPDDIMVKVDRASMSESLESRAPYLDHQLLEFAWSLPLSMKVRGGTGKWLLRQVLYKHVPRELIERPKMGFGVPVQAWLRGPLKGWAEDLLDEGKLRRQGFLDAALVRRKWLEHQNGLRNWHYQLWIVLMFQAWLEAGA